MRVTGIKAQGYTGTSRSNHWVRNFKIHIGSTSESLDYIKDSNDQTMVGKMIRVYSLSK